jgi:hypothetical protein
MSIPHIKAVLKCPRFKGNTRLLLLILADAASNGKKPVDGKPNLPFGFLTRHEKQLMKLMNTKRPDTLVKAMARLVKAGVVVRKRRAKGKISTTFVDLSWLVEHTPNVASSPSDENTQSVLSSSTPVSQLDHSGVTTGSQPSLDEKRVVIDSNLTKSVLSASTESVCRSTPVFVPCDGTSQQASPVSSGEGATSVIMPPLEPKAKPTTPAISSKNGRVPLQSVFPLRLRVPLYKERADPTCTRCKGEGSWLEESFVEGGRPTRMVCLCVERD